MERARSIRATYSSLTEHAATLLVFLLVDLAAREALLEDIERRARRRRRRRVPGTAKRASEHQDQRDYRGYDDNHEERTEDHPVPSPSPPHHVRTVGISFGIGRCLRPRPRRDHQRGRTQRGDTC